MSMWEPFTEYARRSIVLAQEAAQRFGHNYIAPEHILLGITAEPESTAVVLLGQLGVDAAKVRAEVERPMKTGSDKTKPEMVFTPESKRVIELSFEEARELGQMFIGTGHLLLGIMTERDNAGAQVLTALKIDREALRERLATGQFREHASVRGRMRATAGGPFIAFDHVQLAMPAGKEDEARGFYAEILGMTEVPKPKEMAKRGGVWFTSAGVNLHLGVDPEFRPAKKAHAALRCISYERILARLQKSGIDVQRETSADGSERAFVHDPFGNRLELVG